MKHSQTVAKISRINRLLETMATHLNQTQLWSDYKDIYQLGHDYEQITAAIDARKCPSFVELCRMGTILQEFDRLFSLLDPLVLNKEQIHTLYQDMKKHPDLLYSSYHKQLDVIIGINQSIKNVSSPKKYFLEALVAKIKQHIAQNGFSENDETIRTLINYSQQILRSDSKNIEEQYHVIRTLMNAKEVTFSFSSLIPIESQNNLRETLIQYFITKHSSHTLKKRLSAVKNEELVGKDLFDAIEEASATDMQLQALVQLKINNKILSKEEVYGYFDQASQKSLVDCLKYTVQHCHINLLAKSYPASKELINSLANKEYDEIATALHSFEFLYLIIEHEILGQYNQNNVEKRAANQLCYNLQKQLTTEPAQDTKMDITKIYAFIANHIQSIHNEIKNRSAKLESMGFLAPSFAPIDKVIDQYNTSKDDADCTIMHEFHNKIQQAKIMYFCNKGEIKQIEQISVDDVHDFFAACADAGILANKQLADKRSVGTIIIDVLRTIANFCIYLISFGTSPTFFQKPKTAVDNVVKAVNELKQQLEVTLEHLDIDIDLEEETTEVKLPGAHK